MSEIVDRLAQAAFEAIAGAAYNRRRDEIAARAEATLFYEVVFPETPTPEHLRDRVMPPLVRYLRDRSYDPESPHGVVVAAFVGDRCYLLQARKLLDVFCAVEGLNRDALHFRVLRWLNPKGAS
jgi:hypothetical protein